MTPPFDSHMCFILPLLLIIRIACMTIQTRRAPLPPKKKQAADSLSGERILTKRKSPRGLSPSGKRNQKACRHYFETVRIRRVILGILPCVKISNQNRGSNSVMSVLSCTKRLGMPLLFHGRHLWSSLVGLGFFHTARTSSGLTVW